MWSKSVTGGLWSSIGEAAQGVMVHRRGGGAEFWGISASYPAGLAQRTCEHSRGFSLQAYVLATVPSGEPIPLSDKTAVVV